MLPDEPLRDPLENPPPDPPRAFANEIVGAPTNSSTRPAAMSLVVFKVLSFPGQSSHCPLEHSVILSGMSGEHQEVIEASRRARMTQDQSIG